MTRSRLMLRDVKTPTRGPRCDELLVPIAYGYPSLELIDAARRQEIVLGGCTIQGDGTENAIE